MNKYRYELKIETHSCRRLYQSAKDSNDRLVYLNEHRRKSTFIEYLRDRKSADHELRCCINFLKALDKCPDMKVKRNKEYEKLNVENVVYSSAMMTSEKDTNYLIHYITIRKIQTYC